MSNNKRINRKTLTFEESRYASSELRNDHLTYVCRAGIMIGVIYRPRYSETFELTSDGAILASGTSLEQLKQVAVERLAK